MPNFMTKLNALESWLKTVCAIQNFELQALPNDASFRQYFRIKTATDSLIVMLAPPEEKMTAFISIAKNFLNRGIHVPKIINYDLQQGFILLTDLGKNLYFNLLNVKNAEDLYTRALTVILKIQSCRPKLLNNQPLAIFDKKFILTELNLFIDWFLKKHLKLNLSPKFSTLLNKNFHILIDSALEQPYVCVHRDYHSRNLLLMNQKKVGVLDFQDAIYGPITYDAVSLLKDAYIDWPESQIEKWALIFYEMLASKYSLSQKKFIRWFDLMSVQRHLRILGIFSRLCYRDSKPCYLTNTNRLLRYLRHVCKKYPELGKLKHLLQSTIDINQQDIKK